MDEKKILALQVARHRAKKRLLLAELATEAAVPYPLMNKIERAQADPTIRTAHEDQRRAGLHGRRSAGAATGVEFVGVVGLHRQLWQRGDVGRQPEEGASLMTENLQFEPVEGHTRYDLCVTAPDGRTAWISVVTPTDAPAARAEGDVARASRVATKYLYDAEYRERVEEARV